MNNQEIRDLLLHCLKNDDKDNNNSDFAEMMIDKNRLSKNGTFSYSIDNRYEIYNVEKFNQIRSSLIEKYKENLHIRWSTRGPISYFSLLFLYGNDKSQYVGNIVYELNIIKFITIDLSNCHIPLPFTNYTYSIHLYWEPDFDIMSYIKTLPTCVEIERITIYTYDRHNNFTKSLIETLQLLKESSLSPCIELFLNDNEVTKVVNELLEDIDTNLIEYIIMLLHQSKNYAVKIAESLLNDALDIKKAT